MRTFDKDEPKRADDAPAAWSCQSLSVRYATVLMLWFMAHCCLVATASAQAQVKLTASDAVTIDRFGDSVSIDGDRIVVGAPQNDEKGFQAGAAYVFHFDGMSWDEVAKLTASDAMPHEGEGDPTQGAFFGVSVAIDGDRVVVGAHHDDESRANGGAAYVFTYDGTNWNETAKLTVSDAAAGFVGTSVAIDGDRIVLGSHSEAVYVFAYDGSNWVEEAKLTPSDPTASKKFGETVAIDGTRIVVGAVGDGEIDFSAGAAYVFAHDGSNWVEEAKLTASDGGNNDIFGRAVSIDGDVLAVGAAFDDDVALNAGAVYIFAYDGTNWNETAKLIGSEVEEQHWFGVAVAIKADQLAVGSGGQEVYSFISDGTDWTETAKLTASDGEHGDMFGSMLSLSGSRVVVGAPGDDDGGIDAGAAYMMGVGPDADGDGVPDDYDLCRGTAPGDAVDAGGCADSQVDRDGDGVCDPDAPSAGPSGCTGEDVFPDDPTESADHDADGTGDNADPDDDNDGQTDDDEATCGSDPLDAASTSPDLDGDDSPDCVDPDDDGDGADDSEDNCPGIANPGQEDLDGDGEGDACDACDALVNVIGAIDVLIAKVEALGLPGGIENALLSKLENARKSWEEGHTSAAVGQLDALVNQVEAKRGTALSEAEADALITCVQAITDAIRGGTAAKRNEQVSVQPGVPDGYALEAAYPNPFNPQTTIRFAVPEASAVRLVIYDLLGRPVRVLVDGVREAGTHEAIFEAGSLPSGMYVARLETPHGNFVRTMQLVK